MNKFKGYLILSDIDGTITNDRGQFTKENADAIRYFQSEGGLVTVSSPALPLPVSVRSLHSLVYGNATPVSALSSRSHHLSESACPFLS